MTNADRILEYIKKVAPRTVTNSTISNATGIRPHAQVFQITAKLEKAGKIKGRLFGKEWEYWFDPQAIIPAPSPLPSSPPVDSSTFSNARAFEARAKRILENYYGASLNRGAVPNVPKTWDFCSEDGAVVGDAKYFTMVGGDRHPSAKMSVIAEYVWLLSHTGAAKKFLIFGNDRRVIEIWLKKHWHLTTGIDFWFLAEDDVELERLGNHSAMSKVN